jgi:hypothetical protein
VTTTAPPADPAPSEPTAPKRGKQPRWRRILSMVLIVLSCILVPLSVVAVWANNQVLDTDEYVATVAPLARNDEIARAISVRVTNTLFDNVDVEATAEDVLPPRAAFLAGPLTTALREFTERVTLQFFQSEQFQELWDEANRNAHEQVVKALTGGGKVITTRNGEVVLDLSALVVQLRSELSERGIGIFDKLPIGKLSLQFELFDAEGLKNAQAGVRLLDKLAIVLPFLAIVFAAAGIWLASDRRKAIMRWGIGVAIACLVLGFGLLLGRDAYLNALPADANLSAASAAFDIVVRFMRNSNRVLAAIGIIFALGAYLAGSSRVATFVRGKATGALDAVGDRATKDGVDLGAVATFVARHTNGFRVVGIVFAFVILLVLDHPTALTVFVLLGILLVYFAVVGILTRMGRGRMATPTAAQ